MKIFLALALIVCASASHFLPKTDSDIQGPLPLSGNTINLQTYFDSIWDFYGLVQQNASSCFTNAQAYAFFASTGYTWQYLGAVNQGNRVQAAYYLSLTEAFNSTLQTALDCLYNNPSFQTVMFNAGVIKWNHTNFKLLSDIYFYSQFPNYYIDFANVYALLDQQQYSEAGFAYAPMLFGMVNNATGTMINYNFMIGFQNYIFFFYNLTSPTQIPQCYNEGSATMELVFFENWAGVVANSTPETVGNNTQNYFDWANKEFYPYFEPVIDCIGRTEDEFRLINAIGNNVYAYAWQNAVFNYIFNSTSTYFTIFNEMNTAFTNVNPRTAGLLYASFLYAVNASIPEPSDFI